MMLRQLESEDTPIPSASTEEETKATEKENAWTIFDSIRTIANDN